MSLIENFFSHMARSRNIRRSARLGRGAKDMAESELKKFVAALKTDRALREKVAKAHAEGMANIHRHAGHIAKLADGAGFDLSTWAQRPTDLERLPSEQDSDCSLTCCLVATSTL